MTQVIFLYLYGLSSGSKLCSGFAGKVGHSGFRCNLAKRYYISPVTSVKVNTMELRYSDIMTTRLG